MAILTSAWVLDILLLASGYIVYYYLKFKIQNRHFWRLRNVPYIEPTFVVGNTWDANFRRSIAEVFDKMYFEHRDKKVVGFWLYTNPTLLVTDIGLVRDVLVKDFQHFHDRGIHLNEEVEPLNGHLFNMSGSKWRNLRVKLTPTFTSGKMKMMFPTMLGCVEELTTYLKGPAARQEVVEMKDILGRFSTDVISSCAFGIQSNCIKNPNSEFRHYGKQIFQQDFFHLITGFAAFLFPKLGQLITLRQMPKEVHDFFMNTVKETIAEREMKQIKRNDFMDLLIQLKNKGTIESADAKQGRAESEEEKGNSAADKFTVEQAAAQAFVFFAAGFETSSTTIGFTLYELALNPDIQKACRNEVDRVLLKHSGIISYEGIGDLEYLDRVIQESMRKYAPVPTFFRECTKDYAIPGTNITIEKGTSVLIPVSAIQNDPQFFKNPEKFDPDRFTPEEKASRNSFTHLPFGEGPRICIGSRFGMMQTKIALVTLLYSYSFHVCEKTEVPLKMDPKAFIPAPKNGICLKISTR